MKYPALNIIVFILRVSASISICLGIYYLIKETCFYHFIIYGSCSMLEELERSKRMIINIYDGYFDKFQAISLLISGFISFTFAEIIKLGIHISNNTKETAKHLETISKSILERDKLIMKMMGIIVDKMKNK